MTQMLLRLFVKNYTDTENPAVRKAYGTLSGWVGIVCNVLLFAGKLLVGLLSGSISITADAVNNLSDASSSVVTLLGFHLASKPADDKHPYGHERIEYLTGLVVAVMILVIGVELLKSSVEKILHPEPVEFSVVVGAVLVGSIAVKLLMAMLNRTLGKRIGSATLLATAADSRNDVISTGAVLIACLIGHFTTLNIDGWAGLAVALFILYSGVGIARDTINPLLGEAPDEELVHSIAHVLQSHEKVLGIHDLIVHDYGPGRRFASVHVEMDSHINALDAHEYIDDMERDIKNELHVEMVIHYDPIVTDDEELNEMKTLVQSAIHEIDTRLALHDFRMVRGTKHTNLIFDLVVPFDLAGQTKELERKIDEKIQFGDKRYYAVITFDTEAFNDPHTRA